LNFWSRQTGLGESASGTGIIFTDADNMIPDVVWASKERLVAVLCLPVMNSPHPCFPVLLVLWRGCLIDKKIGWEETHPT
jgi:hypothetical protein